MVCSWKIEELHRLDSFSFSSELYQLNRTTYQRVRDWFDQLDDNRRAMISRQLEEYPTCDDLIEGSGKYLHHLFVRRSSSLKIADGPAWAWIMLNLLPIEPDLQYSVLVSQSFRSRLQVINGTIDFLLQHQQQLHQRQQEQQEHEEEHEHEHEHEHEEEQTQEEPVPSTNEWLRTVF